MSEIALEAMLDVVGVTTVTGDRIQPGFLPQAMTLPAITYTRISAFRPSLMGADSGLVRARYQIDCWADTHAAARQLREQVRIAVQRKRGVFAGVTVQDVFIEDDSTAFESEPADASGFGGRFRARIDIQLNYVETS